MQLHALYLFILGEEFCLMSYTITPSGQRYLPMNWVPRWNESYYNPDSNLRMIYFLGLYYYSDLMKQLISGKIVPQFYGEVGLDRYFFIAKYHYPLTYIPHIVLTYNSSSSAVVEPRESYNSLLYEPYLPVYYRSSDNLIFKNLDMFSISASAVSGIINISTSLSGTPIEPDTNFTVVNRWGDIKYVDQTNSSYSSGTIYVGLDGGYTIYYRSLNRFNSIVASSIYISIDGERIFLQLINRFNNWDYLAQYNSIFRNKNETNKSLKTRSQHMTIANKPNQKIAAALGCTVGITWYSSSAAFDSSGYNDWEFQDYSRFLYLNEILVKNTALSAFIFSYPPTGFIQLFLNGDLISSESYTLSGSYLLCNDALLLQASEGSLRAMYKHQRMRPRSYPEVDDLISHTQEDKIYRGILIRDMVTVLNTTKKVKQSEWKWNSEQGYLAGLADFDF